MEILSLFRSNIPAGVHLSMKNRGTPPRALRGWWVLQCDGYSNMRLQMAMAARPELTHPLGGVPKKDCAKKSICVTGFRSRPENRLRRCRNSSYGGPSAQGFRHTVWAHPSTALRVRLVVREPRRSGVPTSALTKTLPIPIKIPGGLQKSRVDPSSDPPLLAGLRTDLPYGMTRNHHRSS